MPRLMMWLRLMLNAVLIWGQRSRRWTSIKTTLSFRSHSELRGNVYYTTVTDHVYIGGLGSWLCRPCIDVRTSPAITNSSYDPSQATCGRHVKGHLSVLLLCILVSKTHHKWIILPRKPFVRHQNHICMSNSSEVMTHKLYVAAILDAT